MAKLVKNVGKEQRTEVLSVRHLRKCSTEM